MNSLTLPIDPEERLKTLKREKLRRLKYEKYRRYVPTGKGEEFINMVADPEIFIAYMSAGNGTGKTQAGINILAHLIWPCGNPYFQGPLFLHWPFPKNILIVSNHETVQNTIIRNLKDQFPLGKYRMDKKGKSYESSIDTDNGWHIDIMTYDQALEAFESSTRGLIWFDEPPTEEIFKACVSRLRKGGIIYITATPINMTAAWLVDKIIERPTDEIQKHGKTDFVQASIESACKTHGVRGFLEHKDIMNMISQYSSEDVQARVFGKSRALIGRVIKSWNRKVHLIDRFKITKEDFVVVEYVDTHPRTPDAVTWVAIDRHNTHYYINQLWVDGDDDQLIEEIKRVRQLYDYRIIDARIEPAAFNVDKHTGYCLANQLAKSGLRYRPASKDRSFNNRQLINGFNYQVSNGRIMKPPKWYVFKDVDEAIVQPDGRTYGIIYEIEHWQWDDWRGKTQETRGLKQTPMDKNDHFIENAARISGANYAFQEYIKSAPVYTPVVVDPFIKSGESSLITDPYAR